MPLPFSWAAPPEPLSPFDSCVAVGMSLALLGYHLGGMPWCAPPPQVDATVAAHGLGGADAAAAAAVAAAPSAAIRHANPAPEAQARQGSVRTVRTILPGNARGRSGADVV